jgi:hypothetical protein
LVSRRISILEVMEIFGNPEIIHYTHPAFQVTSQTHLQSFLLVTSAASSFLVSRHISILEVVEIFGNPKIIHYTHPAFQSFQVLDQFEHDG